MSGAASPSRRRPPRGPTVSGTILSADCSDRGAEIVIRLENAGARAVHYIREIRTVRYDAGTKRLVLGLSDEGSLIGTASVHPEFSYIDPGSAAELKLLLPPRYVKLAAQAAPSGELLFEQFRPADADEIIVEVAWADTPFYEDPRGRPRKKSPTEAWAQGKAVMAYVPPKAPPARGRTASKAAAKPRLRS